MKGIFLIGQDKTEALLLKDVALSLHEEFDSIEIRYPGSQETLTKDSVLIGSKKEIEDLLSKSKIKPAGQVIFSKNKADLSFLREQIKKQMLF